MRFLLDQSADARIVLHLQRQRHDVARVARDHPLGLPDPEVLSIAFREGRILIASDLDFGVLVFVEHQPHAGVIPLRLGPFAPHPALTRKFDEVLARYSAVMDRFIVVTPRRIRVR